MPSIRLYFVRHGQRIDQVDSSWAETSPCPQDPPLTPLGKIQARQTGKIIRDFAYESTSCYSSLSFATHGALASPFNCVSTQATTSTFGLTAAVKEEKENEETPQKRHSWTLQRITPPESPNLKRGNMSSNSTASRQEETVGVLSTRRGFKRQHHFAIVTSPFLRCSQTAIEIATGMRQSNDSSCSNNNHNNNNVNNGGGTSTTVDATKSEDKDKDSRDVVTISVESGLAEWLSLEYVAEPVPDSIIVQRMQEFAMARRDHEQLYAIDWKYLPKDRQLPSWPETREDMQTRLDRTLDHILTFYTAGLAAGKDKSTERDLSIVFVTHASPVNALLEACLQTPILVPVPNCSISRCRWTPLSVTDKEEISGSEDDERTHTNSLEPEPAMLDALMQSRRTQTIAGEDGRWLLDYQTYTDHLDRDHRR